MKTSNKRIWIFIGLIAVFAVALYFQLNKQSVVPTSLTDGLDRAVEFTEPAKKVVSLAPSNTELLFAVGAGDQVIGRDAFSDFPAEAIELPDVGGSMGKYNLEAITALKPDLVLLAEINSPELVKSLEDLGLRVYYLSNPTDLEGMYANLQIVGQLTGNTKEAKALVDELQSRVVKVEKAVATVETKPMVFYEIDGTSDPAKPWTTGPGTFMDTLINKAGGVNAAGELDGAWVQMSQEDLILKNPDFILLGDAAYGVTLEDVTNRSGWNVMTAVKTGEIHPFDDDLASLPGPRLVDGLVNLTSIIHPELADQIK